MFGIGLLTDNHNANLELYDLDIRESLFDLFYYFEIRSLFKQSIVKLFVILQLLV